jgi:hypothetical protein
MGIGLPKSVWEALALLASLSRVMELAEQMLEHLRDIDPDATPPDMPVFDRDHAPNVLWAEGIEEYKSRTMDELWAYLGLKGTLPFFNERIDVDDGQHFWDSKELEAKILASGKPLKPHWHQLVGIAKMLMNVFEGRPVLLMDDISIDKTLQVVGLIVVLAYYREYYASFGKFPGHFGQPFLPSSDVGNMLTDGGLP